MPSICITLLPRASVPVPGLTAFWTAVYWGLGWSAYPIGAASARASLLARINQLCVADAAPSGLTRRCHRDSSKHDDGDHYGGHSPIGLGVHDFPPTHRGNLAKHATIGSSRFGAFAPECRETALSPRRQVDQRGGSGRVSHRTSSHAATGPLDRTTSR
jgi:hypothetical protein